MERLSQYGEFIPRNELAKLTIADDESTFEWVSNVEKGQFAIVGRHFIRLLKGELETDASTSWNISSTRARAYHLRRYRSLLCVPV